MTERRAVIDLQGIRKVYGQGEAEVRALDGVDLRVEHGDYVAIMGASGSGKSTLMNIIGCLDVATTGRYLLDDIDVRRLDEGRLALLAQLYLDTGKYTNALETVQKQLQLAPENPKALFAKAVLQMQLGQFAPAAKTLDEVLKLEPDNNNALLNRAIANLQAGKLDDAKRDYETLRDTLPNGAYQIDYGLAKIAEKQNDKSTALKNYKAYLKHGPVGTAEYTEVQNRVNALEK